MRRRGTAFLASFLRHATIRPALSNNHDSRPQPIHDNLYRFAIDYDHKAIVSDSHLNPIQSIFFSKRYFSGSFLAPLMTFASLFLLLYTFLCLVGSSIGESYHKLWFKEPQQELEDADQYFLPEDIDAMILDREEED
ncbi:unnamed protein product [Phytomonas sp. Hart1]|nr:unnamed protein product [Phytomonas sp. Hart1]|eukprot:CCW66063.1 unnamed protein product [Phytomonas sp. isolate Hart1]